MRKRNILSLILISMVTFLMSMIFIYAFYLSANYDLLSTDSSRTAFVFALIGSIYVSIIAILYVFLNPGFAAIASLIIGLTIFRYLLPDSELTGFRGEFGTVMLGALILIPCLIVGNIVGGVICQKKT